MENEVKKDIKNIFLEEMAEEALKKAVARVVEEHRKSGEPLAVWRGGEVVHVPADQLRGRARRRGSNLPESEKQNELPADHSRKRFIRFKRMCPKCLSSCTIDFLNQTTHAPFQSEILRDV